MGVRVIVRGRRLLEACAGCGVPWTSNFGFGLCRYCAYRRRYERGGARRTWTRQELMAELALLAEAGVFAVDVPAKLGVQWDSITMAYRRAGCPLPVRYRFRTGDLRHVPLV